MRSDCSFHVEVSGYFSYVIIGGLRDSRFTRHDACCYAFLKQSLQNGRYISVDEGAKVTLLVLDHASFGQYAMRCQSNYGIGVINYWVLTRAYA